MKFDIIYEYRRELVKIIKDVSNGFRHPTISFILLFTTPFLISYLSSLFISSYTLRISESWNTPFLFKFVAVYSIGLILQATLLLGLELFWAVFNQSLLQKQFDTYLREYLSLDYVVFSRKSPGMYCYLLNAKCRTVPLITVCLFQKTSAFLAGILLVSWECFKITTPLIFVIILLLPSLYLYLMTKYISERYTRVRKCLAEQEDVEGKIYDKLLNYDVIKTFQLEYKMINVLHRELLPSTKEIKALGQYDLFWRTALTISAYSLQVFVMLLIYLGLLGSNEKERFMVLIIISQLTTQMGNLRDQFVTISNLLNIIKFADIPGDSTGRSAGVNEIARKRSFDCFENMLEWRNVSLYHGEQKILSDICLKIQKGEKVAIVGPNGTGKSTLVKSLLGFVQMDGDILIDGVPTHQIDKKCLYRQISYVPQDDYTSNDTILNNLRLGDENADDEYIYICARTIGSDEMFLKLPEGYNTIAGPRGNRLSGGQKQKLSLTRAVIKNAPIFVLDETSASMDKINEQKLMDHLFTTLDSKTIITIVHGSAHLPRFDKIVFLNRGKIEAVGKYREVVEESENFRIFSGLDKKPINK